MLNNLNNDKVKLEKFQVRVGISIQKGEIIDE